MVWFGCETLSTLSTQIKSCISVMVTSTLIYIELKFGSEL